MSQEVFKLCTPRVWVCEGVRACKGSPATSPNVSWTRLYWVCTSGCGHVGVAFVNSGKDPWLPAEPPGFKSQMCRQRTVSFEPQFPYQIVGMTNTNFISLLIGTQ